MASIFGSRFGRDPTAEQVNAAWDRYASGGYASAQAAVDAVLPYVSNSYTKERAGDKGGTVRVTETNERTRRRALEQLNQRYTDTRNKDRGITTSVVQSGVADPSAQQTVPQSTVDVQLADPSAATQRTDVTGDSAANPAAAQAGRMANTGVKVTTDLTKRRVAGITI